MSLAQPQRMKFISHFNAIALGCISVAGAVMLLPLGAAIHAENIQIIGGKEPIENTETVGAYCFLASLVYVGVAAFSYWQIQINRQIEALESSFSTI
ncbi:hypothetical protein BCR33DRAFT_786724 [Rhizoclosmatium globosum]|uniref:Uncharacterized protein n=1 Tax=Rhizoclosmatium globosum TaxID=329046 RepID=A0A1Y2C4Q2_9FUNG|nr:hypothetical protein BCR33DRAFT_786724 [Rhizoclosmatium globosum]|eukprot:ORY42013.1 hypothetical protein BCR33DRAFT_786724 [Rhizoclosmatium globosum]